MRSGTLYPPQIVGFAKAVEIALAEQAEETTRLTQLRQQLWRKLSQIYGIYLNGHSTQRLPGNLNISVEGVDGAALLLGLQPVMAISSGSACSSAKIAPSHVLLAIGRSEQLAYSSVRFGIGRGQTTAEIDEAAERAIATIHSLRRQTVLH
jgi:cysteine desulfurase